MLTIPIWVNNIEVARAELVRVAPINNRPADGEICTYRARYYNGHPRATVEIPVTHEYVPDNPLPLAIHALEKIQLALLTRTATDGAL